MMELACLSRPSTQDSPWLKSNIMTDRPNTANIQTFIVKIWVEDEVSNNTGKPVWRGFITQVSSGERRYVKSLDEINTYFLKFTKMIGGKENG